MDENRIDSHKLIFHPGRVNQWKRQGDCFPIYVEIGLTSRCNHRCIFCALDWLGHRNGDIDKTILISALKDMADHGVKAIMFAGEGEPLLHGDAPDFIKTAGEFGIKTALTTNGVLLDSKKAEAILPYLSWIRFSVNAGDAEQYAEIHGTRPDDFNRVMKNIENAVKIKNRQKLDVDIGVQVLMLPESIQGITSLAQRVKCIGVDNFQVKPYSKHPKSKNEIIVNDEIYNDFEKTIQSFESPSFKVFFRKHTIQRMQAGFGYTHCHGLSFFALVTTQAHVIPCNLYYERPEMIYGNLAQESFSEIWKGDRRKNVMETLSGKGIKECRKGCRLDAVNHYLERIKYPGPRDDFI